MSKINYASLENKLILVTGATSGMGKGVCIEILNQGAKVIGIGRDSSKIESDIISNKNFSFYSFDLTNIDDIEKIIYQKLTTNLEMLEATQPWYAELITDFSCKTDCLKYLSNDEAHKARISSLRFLYRSGYGEIVKGFSYDLLRAKAELEDLLKKAEYN